MVSTVRIRCSAAASGCSSTTRWQLNATCSESSPQTWTSWNDTTPGMAAGSAQPEGDEGVGGHGQQRGPDHDRALYRLGVQEPAAGLVCDPQDDQDQGAAVDHARQHTGPVVPVAAAGVDRPAGEAQGGP